LRTLSLRALHLRELTAPSRTLGYNTYISTTYRSGAHHNSDA
jgi:hypothetical protein